MSGPRRLPSDLRLEADASARFLPWALAAMVFLAVLALAGALTLDRAVSHWREGVSTRLTVRIADKPGQPMAPRVAAALDLLRGMPGVGKATELDRAGVSALLRPWLGELGSGLTEALPLPGVIDVELLPGQALSVSALATRLENTVPGAQIDDPKPWLDRLVSLARLLQAVGFGVVLVVGLAAMMLVVFATRAGLAARRDTIEVLHLIGAEDAYVARQFQRHVSKLAMLGGLGGWLLAILLLLLIQLLAGNVGQGMLPALGLGWWHWPLLLGLPILGWLLAVFTARLTVLGELRRML